MELILIRGNSHISKIFYAAKYQEGSTAAPDCFSVDGITPDPNAPRKQNANCGLCPHNQWGSDKTPDGKDTKRCGDNRRLAVVSINDLRKNGLQCTPLLLRVPGGSLAPLKEYSDRTLGGRGFPYYSVVTRVGFSPEANFKLSFKPETTLNKQEYALVKNLRDDDRIATIVSESGDLVSPDTPPGDQLQATAPIAPAVVPPMETAAPAAQPDPYQQPVVPPVPVPPPAPDPLEQFAAPPQQAAPVVAPPTPEVAPPQAAAGNGSAAVPPSPAVPVPEQPTAPPQDAMTKVQEVKSDINALLGDL